MKTQLGRVGTWRQEVCSAEGGQKVIKRHFVRNVDRCQTKAPPVLVAAKDIVISHRNVEQVARRDPWRIVIVILGARCRNRDSR